MNQSKLKLTTIIALTAFTVAVIPACLQRKSANAASKYTYKKGFTYEKISPKKLMSLRWQWRGPFFPGE